MIRKLIYEKYNRLCYQEKSMFAIILILTVILSALLSADF